MDRRNAERLFVYIINHIEKAYVDECNMCIDVFLEEEFTHDELKRMLAYLLEKVKDEFGIGFFDWRGQFRRKEFGNHIFRFPKQRVKYENIIMPYIIKEINEAFERYEKHGEKLVILDAPTLIENGLHTEMDYVMLVYADSKTQIQRGIP